MCVLLLESSISGESSPDKTRLLTAGLMTVAVRAGAAVAMTAGVAVTLPSDPRRAGVKDTSRGRREGVTEGVRRVAVVVAGSGGAPAAAAAAVEATLTMAAVLGTCKIKKRVGN